MSAPRTGIPFAAALLAAACLSGSLRPCACKGGGGTGGTAPSTPSYSSGSSSYYRPPSSYYAPNYRPSGYHYGSGGHYYGSPGYSSSSSNKSGGGFWAFLLPAGLIVAFCCCCTRGKYKAGSSSHYSKMQQTNNGFLVGTIKAPYKAQGIPEAHPVALSNRAFALPGGHAHITRWRGGYTESGRLKHTMYELSFPPLKPGALDGAFSGSGMDDDGGFRVEGIYSLKTGRFVWTELYPSGMRTAVQQQGIAAGASSVIESMRGTYAATTGIHGEMTMTVDIEMGSSASSAYPHHQPQQQHPPSGAVHHYAPAATAATAPSGPPPNLPTYPSAPQPPPGYPAVAHQQQPPQHHSAPPPHGAAPPGYPSAGAAPNPYAQQQQQPAYPPAASAPMAPGASLWGGPNHREDADQDLPAPKI